MNERTTMRTTISGVDCVRALRKVGFRVTLVSERRTHVTRGPDALRIPRLPKLSDATLDLILLGACLSRDDLDALLVDSGESPRESGLDVPASSHEALREAVTIRARRSA